MIYMPSGNGKPSAAGLPDKAVNQVKVRVAKAGELKLSGATTPEIAKELNCSERSVRNYINKWEQQQVKRTAGKAAQKKAGITAHHERHVAEAIKAWEASKGKRVKRKVKKNANGEAVVEIEEYESPGDPRYLAEATKILGELAKLHGAYAAEKHELIATVREVDEKVRSLILNDDDMREAALRLESTVHQIVDNEAGKS